MQPGSKRIAAVEKRLQRCFGRNMRLHWDRERKLYIVQERGRRTGAWNYVLTVAREDGRFREPGEWLLARLHSADMMLIARGQSGAAKFKAMREGPRKRRIFETAREAAERFAQSVAPRVADKLSRAGATVHRSALTPEQRIAALRASGASEEALEAAQATESHVPIRAYKVFQMPKVGESC